MAEDPSPCSATASTDGCVHRRRKQGADSEEPSSTSVEAAAGPQLASAEEEEYQQFVFPVALDNKCLDDEKEAESDSDDSDDEVDTKSAGFGDSILQSKMFSDPVEREKWKQRGWRAVQCCGGALLVLALIFDELD
mmetsp:Transcript_28681/g.52233  ORF Transcript_28681/g.52233 Transcript_28681/m.52233 type:complete len:136 (+) Transcript_28681:59-466(+)